MSNRMRLIGFIADHPTPKICIGGGIAYTQNSRGETTKMLQIWLSKE
jgi:hypothetical protein